jgi:hypothetical protein
MPAADRHLCGQIRQHFLAERFKNCPVPEKTRDGNAAQAVEMRPFFRVFGEELSVIIQVAEGKVGDSAVYSFPYLAANLPETGPAQAQAGQTSCKNRMNC